MQVTRATLFAALSRPELQRLTDSPAEFPSRQGESLRQFLLAHEHLSVPRILGLLQLDALQRVCAAHNLGTDGKRAQLRERLWSSYSRWPTAIDLFSGAGGLTLGLRRARFRVVGAVDVDELAVETYRLNHPSVHTWLTDIRTLSVARVKQALDLRSGELELLAGCPPCQGFSSLKTLNGGTAIKDPRNDLVFEFLRFVHGLKPRAIMMENVPGLSSDARLARFRAELEELGYQVKVEVLDAADFGVPQRRRRMILLASRSSEPCFAKSTPRRRTVAGAIRRLTNPARSRDPLHNYTDKRAPRILALIRRIPKDGGSRSALGEDQLGCHKRCDGFSDIYGRMSWRDVAPTITGGCINPSKGRFLHPSEDRSITLREAAVLQSFPTSYRFSLRRGKYHTAEMIGNALPPEFIRRHALALRTSLRST